MGHVHINNFGYATRLRKPPQGAAHGANEN